MGQPRKQLFNELYQDYESGLSLSKLSKNAGVTRQCLYKAFKLRGLNLRTMPKRNYQIFDGKKFTLRNTGYYSLTTGDRKLMHRYVWEKHNGTIPFFWDIHHINGVKSDNRIENLECLTKSEHSRKYNTGNNQFTKINLSAGN